MTEQTAEHTGVHETAEAMGSTPGDTSISAGEAAGVHDTTSDATTPPLQETHVARPSSAEEEVNRLWRWLNDQFPLQVALTNRQHPETPVDVAIRLLSGMASATTPQQVTRCAREFCNKPDGHADICGWVHYQ